jgi:tetratricopeptide (TPR) repeat protein
VRASRIVFLLSVTWLELRGAEAWRPARPDECLPLLSQGESYYRRGAYDQAEDFERRALTCQELRLPLGHPDLAASYDRLAELSRLRRKFREAENFAKKALTIWSEDPEGYAADLAEASNGLALIYFGQRRYREAVALALEAKTLWEKAQGPESFGVVRSLNTLTVLHLAAKDFTTAERYCRLALGFQNAAARQDLLTAGLLHNLANIRFQSGFATEAERLYRESLRLQEELLNPHHPALAATLEAYAKVLKRNGRRTEARRLKSRAYDLPR